MRAHTGHRPQITNTHDSAGRALGSVINPAMSRGHGSQGATSGDPVTQGRQWTETDKRVSENKPRGSRQGRGDLGPEISHGLVQCKGPEVSKLSGDPEKGSVSPRMRYPPTAPPTEAAVFPVSSSLDQNVAQPSRERGSSLCGSRAMPSAWPGNLVAVQVLKLTGPCGAGSRGRCWNTVSGDGDAP